MTPCVSTSKDSSSYLFGLHADAVTADNASFNQFLDVTRKQILRRFESIISFSNSNQCLNPRFLRDKHCISSSRPDGRRLDMDLEAKLALQ
jgi:hypothetical protein